MPRLAARRKYTRNVTTPRSSPVSRRHRSRRAIDRARASTGAVRSTTTRPTENRRARRVSIRFDSDSDLQTGATPHDQGQGERERGHDGGPRQGGDERFALGHLTDRLDDGGVRRRGARESAATTLAAVDATTTYTHEKTHAHAHESSVTRLGPARVFLARAWRHRHATPPSRRVVES